MVYSCQFGIVKKYLNKVKIMEISDSIISKISILTAVWS